jgi:hypothetical protein
MTEVCTLYAEGHQTLLVLFVIKILNLVGVLGWYQ